jgi:hypothetical protein
MYLCDFNVPDKSVKEVNITESESLYISDLKIFSEGIICTACNDGYIKFWTLDFSLLKTLHINNYIYYLDVLPESKLLVCLHNKKIQFMK